MSRVHYIDPNSINGERVDSHSSTNYIGALEDYCITVELEISYSERNSFEFSESERLVYSFKNGNLMRGTNGHLTTNFTDIDHSNPTNNTDECLGIKSIDITMETQSALFSFAPKVDIKFVDVRAASVLSKQETNKKSLFSSLFSFPYPIFKLYVKGFYGGSVCYTLTPHRQTEVEFDASNGDTIITAHLIGQMYGIYSDLPFQYIVAAPYMSYVGKDYWNTQIVSNAFAFKEGDKYIPMITFAELRKRISEIPFKQNVKQINKNHKKDDEKVNTDYDIYKALSTTGYFFNNGIWHDLYKKGLIFGISKVKGKKNIDREIKEIKEKMRSLPKAIKESAKDKVHKEEMLKSLNFLEESIENITYIEFLKDKNGDNHTFGGSYGLEYAIGGTYDKNSDVFTSHYSLFPEIKKDIDNLVSNEYYVLYLIKRESADRGVQEVAGDILQKTEAKKRAIELSYISTRNAIIEKTIGFPPTIKNIYSLIFAHINTFIHTFYSCLNGIRSEERGIKELGIARESTDIKDLNKLPPFTLFSREVNKNGVTKRESIWPADIPNCGNLSEIQFVESLLRASALYSLQSIKVDKLIEGQEEKVEFGNEEAKIDTQRITKDMKLSTYFILKKLFDRWFGCAKEERWDFSMNNLSEDSDFCKFKYIDTYYNEIGDNIIVDCDELNLFLSSFLPSSNAIDRLADKQTITCINEIATRLCGGNLLYLPTMYGIKDIGEIEKLFRVNPYETVDFKDKSQIVFLYSYKPSESLNINKGNRDDGFDCDAAPSFLHDKEDGIKIPAFGVAFAKQNQSIFKSIDLSSDTFNETNISIDKTIETASRESRSPRETALFGQNIYSLYSSRQYNCSITMMGNAQIMPLMYFQLNNIPFWKGTYMVIDVSHRITPGDMETTIKGVRINKNTIPLYDGDIATIKGGEKVKYSPNMKCAFNSNLVSVSAYPYSDKTKLKDEQLLKGNQIKAQIMQDMGWADFQAAALIGCIMAESGGKMDPQAINLPEKMGKNTSSSGCYKPYIESSGYRYGAGIIQWTTTTSIGKGRKLIALEGLASANGGLIRGKTPQNFLEDIGNVGEGTKPPQYQGGIENLTLSEQVQMIEYELRTTYGATNKTMLSTQTLEEALAVMFCAYIGGGNWKSIPTPTDVFKKGIAYQKVNKNIGDPEYFYKQRLGFAKNFC